VKFLSLQALRAIAATVVVIFHAQGLCHKYASHPSLSEAAAHGLGQYGVDLFFVLSGFVILYTTQQGRSTAGTFLLRRLIRIVPIYWLLTIAALAMPFLVPGVFSLAPGLPPLRPVAESLLFASYALHERAPVLYVGWSVEYEMLFYVLASLALAARLPLYRTLALVFIGLYAGVHWLAPPAAASGTVLFFLGYQVVFEFILGLLLGQILLRQKLTALDIALPVLAIALVILMEGGGRFLIAGLPAAAIVAVALLTESRTCKYRVTRWLAKVGDASYSIYLLQVLALPAIGKLWLRLVPDWPPDLLVLIASLLVVMAGMLLYQGVERPLLTGLQRLLLPRRVPAATPRVSAPQGSPGAGVASN
jgi:peptidoglycan/LPS O-acetylase OafA/YrhL